MKCSFIKNSAHIHPQGFMYPCTMSSVENGKMGKICNDLFETAFKNKLDVDENICYRCIENEKAGLPSFSKWNNNELEEHFLLDIRLDNNCNFKCLSCNGKSSISFKNEEPNVKYISLFDILVKNIDFIRKFKRIYFGGGEPFLAAKFLEFLKMLNKDQEILISSNISCLKNDIIAELKLFKKTIFYPSIDHIYEKGAYVRYGFNQNTFDNNLNILLKDFECIPVITVSALNAHNLDQIVLHLSNFVNLNSIYFNILESPEEMKASVLPIFLKAKAIANIKKIKSISDYNYIVDSPYNINKGCDILLSKIKRDDSLYFNSLISKLKEKDRLRKNSFKILFDGLA